MPEHQQGASITSPGSSEVLIQAIAGPETARLLGIKEGDVFDARHVYAHVNVQPGPSTPPGEDVVSPDDARAIKDRLQEG